MGGAHSRAGAPGLRGGHAGRRPPARGDRGGPRLCARGPRTAHLRKTAWGAQAAARAVDDPSAKAAARAAIAAAGAPYTHPIETPHQINHILGPAAYAVQALSFGADDEAGTMETELRWVIASASEEIRRIVAKMPERKPSKGAFHALLYRLDTALRL